MVALSEIMKYLRPDLVNGVDYIVLDNGNSTSLVMENPPSEQELQSAVSLTESAIAKAWLANERWTREAAGITVGTQFVSTNRDEMPVWQGMVLDAFVLRPGIQSAYEYKPRGGVNTTLTPTQVGRAYECFAWYVAALFAVERQVAAAIDAAATNAEREAVLAAIPWPQTTFNWEPPQ